MISKSHRRASALEPLAAALIVLLVYQLTSAIAGTNPFTGGSLLAGDYSDQYLGMFNYLHLVVSGQAHGAYSLANGLGGGMMGNWAYYLLSPFNLLALPFSKALMPYALFALGSLKLAAMAATFNLFARRRWAELTPNLRLALSVAYGLMGYALTYQREFMWLDALVFLPLIVLGLRQILRGGRILTYTWWLAITLMANYYTGFMVCIFIALFTAFLMLGEEEWRDLRAFALTLLKVVGASLLAIAMAAIVLVPTFMNLLGAKLGVDTGTPVLTHNPFVLASRLLIGAVDDHIDLHPGVLSVPTIYVGGLALMCAILYFAARGISRRARVSALVYSLVWIGLSFSTKGYLLLHGGSNPVGYPYRYAFLLSFWLLYLAGDALLALQKGELNPRFIWGLAGLVLLATGVLVLKRGALDATLWRVTLSGFLYLLPLLLFVLGRRQWQATARMILVVVVVEMGVNAELTSAQTKGARPVSYYQRYNNEMTTFAAVMQRDRGTQPVRADKNFMRHIDRSDGLVYGYNSASIFSSNLTSGTPELMRLFGQRTAGYYVQYSNGTALTDAILGMRYQMTSTRAARTQHDAMRVYGSRADLQGTVIARRGQERLYRLAEPVALAFTHKGTAEPELLGGASLANQERVLQNWSGSQRSLLADVPLKITAGKNAQAERDGKVRVQGKHATVSWTLARTSKQVYLSVPPAYYTKPNKLYLNGKKIAIFPGYPVTVPLGVDAKHHSVRLTVKLSKTTGTLPAVTASSVRRANLRKTVQAINRGALHFTRSDAGNMRATVTTAGSKQVVTTIPAERGWQVQVDGKTVNTGTTLKGVFMTFAVQGKGKHVVTMRYRTPGFLLGLLISVAGLIVLLIIWLRTRRQRWR